MNEARGYAVFFFPQALEVLGEAIRPYLSDGPAGPHLLCAEVDAGGPLAELILEGRTPDGREIALELMVPTNMIRMVVSARSDGVFGFIRDTPSLAFGASAAGDAEPAPVPPARGIKPSDEPEG
ncbi:hypothetical protein [Vulcaniibacterium gelatinicum]|uniref:hypothetical protein n=1 Tax=Vulcaniibacterium gelatinicum TaxID=2598725 RepID=UPI0011C90534|nr:hypothetical protein [Vulcaniibacterium gelatinicum]